MNVPDAVTEFALRFYRRGDGSMRGAPGDDQQIAVGISRGHDVGNILGDGFNFCSANANHVFVIERFVVDVAGDVLFFQTADAVFEPRRSGNGPGARESIGIAAVGFEVDRIGRKLHFEIRNGFEIGNAPWLGSVCKIAIRQDDDRNHVFNSDPRSFDGRPEAIAGRSGSDYGNRSLRIASEKSLQQIGLFGFGRQACRWTAALDVADDERQFERHGQADRLALQRDARPRGRRHRE